MDDITLVGLLSNVFPECNDSAGHGGDRGCRELDFDWDELDSQVDDEIDFDPRRRAPEVDFRGFPAISECLYDLTRNKG